MQKIILIIVSLFGLMLPPMGQAQGTVSAAVTFKENDGVLHVFSSPDGMTFYQVSDSFQDPAPLRDPTMIYSNGYYWCAYTMGNGSTGEFGLANSPDGINWTPVAYIACPGAHAVWAPSWFIDSDSSIHIVLAFFPTANPGQAYVAEMHPTNTGMTSWSSPSTVYIPSGGISAIDPFIILVGGNYYLWYKNDTAKYIEVAVSSSAFTGYSAYATGDWNSWGHGNLTGVNNGYEAPCVLLLTNGSAILYSDSSVSQGIVYSTSPDGIHGWSPFKLATFSNPNGYTMSGPDVRQLPLVTPPTQSPALQIRLSGTNVVLTWPWVPPGGFILETTCDLTTTNPWTTVSNLPPFQGVQYTATNPVCGGNRFFRLRQ